MIFYCICLFISSAHASTDQNIWDVLAQQFNLDHELNQPQVQHQLRWIIAHPDYVTNLAQQAEPYIYHIVTEIQKRHLPGEIALVPMIESSYDPFAYSGAGAAGLWQLMPDTSKDLGLKRDWWLDSRRSIRPSTNAALNYLTYLHNYFNGEWELAFAAYDAGEGAMTRIIKKSNQRSKSKVDFWTLSVPQETRAYVPRLLALAEVFQHAARYHIKLPYIPHAPYFEEVNIGSQIDLNHAAKLAGISYKDLIKLNPGFNRWATAPYRPFKLLIPADKVAHFTRNLTNLLRAEQANKTSQDANGKNSLIQLAKKYNQNPAPNKAGAQKPSAFKKVHYTFSTTSNQPLARPIKPQPAHETVHIIDTKKYKTIHIVQKSDSLQKLQSKYGVSAEALEQWNHINSKTPLHVGQQLTIWKSVKTPKIYTVKRGETLGDIASRYHTSINVLVHLNPSMNRYQLHSGQQIRIG